MKRSINSSSKATGLLRKLRGRDVGDWVITILMFGLALSWLYPYIWMVMAGLKDTRDIFNSSLFGGRLSLDNVYFLFDSSERLARPFLKSLFNSMYITITVTVSVMITSVIVAYALAKTQFPGRDKVRGFLIFQMVVPSFMFVLPMFVLIREMGLIDTYSAMILPAAMSGWGIFMLSQSFKGTPDDYIEAAKLDRASLRQIMFNIMVPLNRAVFAIVALFTFTGTWDNFLWPLIAMRDPEKMPLSVLLATFSKQYGDFVGPIMAGAVLQTLPLLILFVIFRKYFLQGMSLSLK